MADHFSADRDQLVPQRCQRPVPHAPRQRQATQEVAQVIRQHVQLQPHLVGIEAVTRQPCPAHRVLAFLDPLLDMPITMLPLSQLLTGLEQRI